MSAKSVWSQYKTQLGYYNEVNAIRESIVSIQGIVKAGLVMFDFATGQIGRTQEVVDGAKIVIDGFKTYEEILNDNKNLIVETDNKLSEYLDELDSAYNKAESDLEVIHSYMVYLHEKYFYGLDQESNQIYDWERRYHSYKGEKFKGIR